MFKKLLFVLSLINLTACVGYIPYPQFDPSYTPAPQPKQRNQQNRDYDDAFDIGDNNNQRGNKARYQISTENMKKFILAKNNLEYCLLPELGKQKDDRLNALEKQLLKDMINEKLESIVGKSATRTIFDDPHSYEYFQFKYRQLKNNINNIRNDDCRILKEHYRDRFKESKRKQGLETRNDSIEARFDAQHQSIEEQIRQHQNAVEQRINEQQRAMERRFNGENNSLYKTDKSINIDWQDPFQSE